MFVSEFIQKSGFHLSKKQKPPQANFYAILPCSLTSGEFFNLLIFVFSSSWQETFFYYKVFTFNNKK